MLWRHIDMSESVKRIKNDTKKTHWYRLDNAAKVFPSVLSTRLTTVFRLSLTLKKPIRILYLQQALENIIHRFPYYNVQLKRGLFWYYFEINRSVPIVYPENRYPCSKITMTKRVFPFRVKAYGSRIAVELSHMLTDGSGALIFLNALTAEYLHLCGLKINDRGDLFHKDQEPDKGEFEYAFRNNYKKDIPGPPKLDRAFHIPFGLERKGVYHVLTGIVFADRIIKQAKDFGVSISELLTAILMESIYKVYRELPPKQQKHAIRVLLAVNLRKLYPSITMRNFTLFVTPEIDPRLGVYSFEEILKGVHHYIQMEVNEKLISRQLSRNMGGELHPVGRMVPRVVKDLFFSAVYNTLGEFLATCSLSNFGRVILPDEVAAMVERYDFIPAPSPVAKKHCAVIAYKNNMHISFGRVIKETHLERHFFTKLIELGIPVKVETN
jgi:hypothetical protein